jgi:hypothetical protein
LQIGKISGTVDKTVVPRGRTIDQELEDAKALAIERCVAAGGNKKTIEIVEVETVPVSYVTNGATRLFVRVVADLVEGHEEPQDSSRPYLNGDVYRRPANFSALPNGISDDLSLISKGSSYDIIGHIDVKSYRPRIEGDLWYLSELDLQFLQDGTGVLGVGSCGEPYPVYLACLLALRNGGDIIIRRQDTLPDDAVVLVGSFMVKLLLIPMQVSLLTLIQGSPSVYLERIPGLNEYVISPPTNQHTQDTDNS